MGGFQKMKSLHLGIPTEHKLKDKKYAYVEAIKLHVTNANDHAYNLQYVWAEPDSPLPEIVKTEKHFAVQVDNIEGALEQFDYVAYPPVVVNDKLKICFAVMDGVLFELTEISA